MPSVPSFEFQALTSVGIELEGTGMTRNSLMDFFMGNSDVGRVFKHFRGKLPFDINRDASTEFMASSFKPRNFPYSLLVSNHTEEFDKYLGGSVPKGGVTMGYEIISRPLEIKDFPYMIYPLTMKLCSLGEFISSRASTHYHIGFPHNLKMMKNLLAFSLYIDPVLFRLGGAGGVFRGHFNNSAYARPLLNSAAVEIGTKRSASDVAEEIARAGIKSLTEITMEDVQEYLKKFPGSFYQIINPLNALMADDISTFWASFGVSSGRDGTLPKYHPCRYSGINFFSILMHGTIEFRHMNQTLDPNLIFYTAKFLRAAVEMCSLLGKNDTSLFSPTPSNQEISIEDAVGIMETVRGLCIQKEIDDIPSEREFSYLLQTIENSKVMPIPEIPVRTHIADFKLTKEIVKVGNLQKCDKIMDEEHIDIHNIANRKLSIFN